VIDRYLATLPNSKTELPFQETDFFSPEYKKAWAGFYRLRFKDKSVAREAVFEILDKYRNTRPLDFRTILVQLQEKTGRLDKFFASKIIATLDQNQVIIDSIVLGELSLKVRKDINPIDSAVEIYTSISQINSAAIKQEKFITLKSKLAKIVNLEKISDVKLFDMLLWLSIERKSKEKLSL
jgi:hypothetical protein